MAKLGLRQEIKMLTRETMVGMALDGRLSWAQAARALRMSTRQLRRVRKRYEELGRKGLFDGRGQPRGSRIGDETAERM